MKKYVQYKWLLFITFPVLIILFIGSCRQSDASLEISLKNENPLFSINPADINCYTKTATVPPTLNKPLTLHFLDVGQADATFIELPNNMNMLIDGGNIENGPEICSYLNSHQVKKIDILIGTHPHADHIGGLIDIIEQFEIGVFYMPKTTYQSQVFESLLVAAEKKVLQIKTARSGITLFQEDCLNISILAPVHHEYELLNDYSAVIKIEYGEISFLIMGDGEASSETDILKTGLDVSATVLKLGGHGGSASSTEPFLLSVAPEYGIISCGENNPYGYPHQEILNRLLDYEIPCIRTDHSGTVIMQTDGLSLSVFTEKTGFSR